MHYTTNILIITNTTHHFSFWMPYNTAAFGNCYTFNSAYHANDTEAPRMATLTGMSNGLIVEMFLDQGNYMLER